MVLKHITKCFTVDGASPYHVMFQDWASIVPGEFVYRTTLVSATPFWLAFVSAQTNAVSIRPQCLYAAESHLLQLQIVGHQREQNSVLFMQVSNLFSNRRMKLTSLARSKSAITISISSDLKRDERKKIDNRLVQN